MQMLFSPAIGAIAPRYWSAGFFDAGNDIHQHDRPPVIALQQKADDQRRNSIADIAAHAVEGHHQALPFREAISEPGDRGGMPDIVPDTH